MSFFVRILLLGLFAGNVLANSATSPATQPVRGHVPTAASVTITPTTPKMGDVVAGAYTYSDIDGDAEGGTTFQWLREGVVISGAIATTYTTTPNDVGKIITFQVTPKSENSAYPDTGTTVMSAGIRPVPIAAQGTPIVDVTDITGELTVGSTLTGVYTFYANGGDTTDKSIKTWGGGAGNQGHDTTYLLTYNDVGNVLTFSVKAMNGRFRTGNVDSIDTAHARGVSIGSPLLPPKLHGQISDTQESAFQYRTQQIAGFSEQALSHDAAVEYCNKYQGGGYRLPTYQEMKHLDDLYVAAGIVFPAMHALNNENIIISESASNTFWTSTPSRYRGLFEVLGEGANGIKSIDTGIFNGLPQDLLRVVCIKK